ncbi:4'-phosphopantetheinyl transferase superfamily protein [Brachybacterium squillarum]|uniref:4'-phosphopantetheinyl transferase superfamily protein n=1 Tax=Brachybacterium squillarum TaxID=661979 RepID=UPI000A01142D
MGNGGRRRRSGRRPQPHRVAPVSPGQDVATVWSPFSPHLAGASPPPFIWAEGRFHSESDLHVSERRAMHSASASRRIAYSGARACARAAMATGGLPPGPVLKGRSGEPVWPSSEVVGSLSHSRPFCAAGIAMRDDVPGLGVDIEVHRRLPDEVRSAIATDAEYEEIRTSLKHESMNSVEEILLFSAKEACYKALCRSGQALTKLSNIRVNDFASERNSGSLHGRFRGKAPSNSLRACSLLGMFQQDVDVTRVIAWRVRPCAHGEPLGLACGRSRYLR